MEGGSAVSIGIIAWQVQLDATLCGICGFAILWFFVAVFVYEDADRRGMRAVAWFLVVLLFGIIGLIVYLDVRRKPLYEPSPAEAPPAHFLRQHVRLATAPAPTAPPKDFGAALPSLGPGGVGRSCPSCEANIPFDAAFCPNCGKPIA